ncbi:antibiotic biosynthesis monooxygenase [Brevundimonas sp.]|uniref:putative quinol monooxygenase n=1 Tax=Brevundimonas sp. TaxID=1871086 RepID=UPI001A2D79B9|nr:antibiotic biosynthesis monooxygenase [Brevundimonas sp.]MBJ7483183.1 antibiotic biosynthesis monooxygenase [Brevundimonas sp.]
MIFEQATIQVAPEKAVAFEAAIAATAPLFRRAQGCTSLALERMVETPGRYVLRIGWNTVEDHTEIFTKSADFAEFVAMAGPFMTETPSVIHVVPTSLF